MKTNKRKIIIANWKMNLGVNESIELAKVYRAKFKKIKNVQIAIAANFLALPQISKILKGTNILLGAQDVFWENKGAYTGEISPKMLKEVGCKFSLIGHSERREYLLENYEMIHKKIKAMLKVNLIPVVCVGERKKEREQDKQDYIIVDQLKQALSGIDLIGNQLVVISYEPIWAIGTGLTIKSDQAEYIDKIIKITLNELVGFERAEKNVKILYGGSINNENIKKFTPLKGIDGLLIGGASLKINEFIKIVNIINNK